MSSLNFDNVKLCEDTINDVDIIKSMIDMENDEEPFCILDVGNVAQKHQDWIEKMPKVVPHYGIIELKYIWLLFFFYDSVSHCMLL